MKVNPIKMINPSMPSITRGKWSPILFAFLMVASLPAMSLVGGLDSATANEDTSEVIYTASHDETVKAIGTSGTIEWEFEDITDSVWDVELGADSESVYASTQDGELIAIDADSGEEEWRYEDGDTLLDNTVHPNGERIYVADPGDESILKIDTSDGSLIDQYDDFEESPKVGISSDGEYLAMSIFDREDPDEPPVRVLDPMTMEVEWTHDDLAGDGGADDLVPSNEENTFYVVQGDAFAKYDFETGEQMFLHENKFEDGVSQNGVVSPDDETVYATSLDNGVMALDATDGSQLWHQNEDESYRGVTLSEDGSELFAGEDSGDIYIHETDDGSEAEILFDKHSDQINSIENLLEAVDPITGQVTDQNGDPVDQANVSFEHTETGDTESVLTEPDGSFSVILENATYDIEITHPQYQTFTTTQTIDEGEDLGTFELETTQLDLQLRSLMDPDSTQSYTVEFENETGTNNVTAESDVTSSNDSVAEIDQEIHEIIGQPGVNETVDITANYTAPNGEEYTVTEELVVAEETVENLDILPGVWRYTALIGDGTYQVILVGILAGVVATRASTAFGGLGGAQLVLTAGWLGGWVSLGIVLVGLFTAMFIGLNLAANIDYTVRR